MVFDPSTSKNALEQGFTSCNPEDLPSEIPSRSLADNMNDKLEVTGAMRTKRFGSGGGPEVRVSAYKKVQFGAKAGKNDAEDEGFLRVGNYKDNGQ